MAGKKDKINDKDRFSVLVSDLGHCCVCGSSERICLHEIFHGVAFRKKSKEDGMVIPLCFEHHQGTNGVHNNIKLEEKFKEQAEKIWISKYTDDNDTPAEKIKKFINRYGKNYINEEDLEPFRDISENNG